MATIDQLMAAFGAFGQAAKEYGVTKGIQDATTAVTELKKNTELDYQQRIAMQGQVANQLQAGLAGLGAGQAQIAAAVGAIAPPKINSAADALALANNSVDPVEREALLKEANTRAKVEGQMQLEQAKPLTTFQTDEDIRKQRALLQAQPRELNLTPAQKRFDEKMSEQLAEWDPTQFATATNSLNAAQEVLASGATSTGITGKLAAMRPGSKTSMVGNDIRASIQEMLKPIYGSQFTEKEGERFFATLYDPGDPESENIRRLEAFKTRLAAKAANMEKAAQVYAANGTFGNVKLGGEADGRALLGELNKQRKAVNKLPADGKKESLSGEPKRPAGVDPRAIYGTHKTKDGKLVKGWKIGNQIQAE